MSNLSQLPPPSTLQTLSELDLTLILDNLFEPCPALTNYLLPELIHRPLNSYSELIELSRQRLYELCNSEYPYETELHDLICKIVSAHPRLGAPKINISKLSEHSKNEQKSLESGSKELSEKLKSLNEKYEQTYPGLRFVVFVNGRSREEIMKIMNFRIDRHNWKLEVKDAFDAMLCIAFDRAKKLGAKL